MIAKMRVLFNLYMEVRHWKKAADALEDSRWHIAKADGYRRRSKIAEWRVQIDEFDLNMERK